MKDARDSGTGKGIKMSIHDEEEWYKARFLFCHYACIWQLDSVSRIALAKRLYCPLTALTGIEWVLKWIL